MDAATKLDRIDINILVQLQKDGRMTNVSLAEAVGLSPALACSASSAWRQPATSAATKPTSTSPRSPTR